MRLFVLIAGVWTLVTLAGGCGGGGTRADGGAGVDAGPGRETGSVDRPSCEPDAPYIAFMQAHMTGYRGNGYSSGKEVSPAKDQITIGDVSFYGSDNLMRPRTPGTPLEGRLLAANGEELWQQNLGDPLWSEYGGQDGLREDDLVLGVQLFPGGVFYQVFDRGEQESILVFDLRPHIQRLCAEQPCLKLCQPPEDAGADGAGADVLVSDGGQRDGARQ